MEQVYKGDGRGNPFMGFAEIGCPVRITTSEKSRQIYKDMAARAASLIPDVTRQQFDGVDHCVVQEAPQLVLHALREFGREAG